MDWLRVHCQVCGRRLGLLEAWRRWRQGASHYPFRSVTGERREISLRWICQRCQERGAQLRSGVPIAGVATPENAAACSETSAGSGPGGVRSEQRVDRAGEASDLFTGPEAFETYCAAVETRLQPQCEERRAAIRSRIERFEALQRIAVALSARDIAEELDPHLARGRSLLADLDALGTDPAPSRSRALPP